MANNQNYDQDHAQNHTGQGFTFAQVAHHLNVSPDTLRRLTRRFDRHLGDGIYGPEPNFRGADVAALVTVQQLLSQGYDDEQIHQHLTPSLATDDAASQIDSGINGTDNRIGEGTDASTSIDDAINHTERRTSLATVVDSEDVTSLNRAGLPKAINDVIDTLLNGQKAVLNSQSSVRDMIGVVAQDNFNLKEENRKLRERMLELERTLAENQRREEARRERVENRMRALEATVGALQQQVAQVVQALRRPPKRRGWFS